MDENEPSKIKTVRIARLFVPCTYNPLKAAGKVKNCDKICKVVSWNMLPVEPDYTLTYTLSEFEIKMNHREFWTQYFRSIFCSKNRDPNGENSNKECGSLRDPGSLCDFLKNSKIFDSPNPAQKALQNYLQSKIYENDERILSIPLSPLQIYKVSVLPFELDFGAVCIKKTLTY